MKRSAKVRSKSKLYSNSTEMLETSRYVKNRRYENMQDYEMNFYRSRQMNRNELALKQAVTLLVPTFRDNPNKTFRDNQKITKVKNDKITLY